MTYNVNKVKFTMEFLYFHIDFIRESKMINNKPKIKIGIVAVSRDCFPESLSVNRRKALVEAYTKKYGADESPAFVNGILAKFA